VDEVGARELQPSTERVDEAAPFDHRRRDGEPREREPRDRREDHEPKEQGDRQPDEDPHCEPDEEGAERRPVLRDERTGADVRRRDERREQPEDDGLLVQRPSERDLVERRDAESEREDREETRAVEPDRLGDELSDGARLGRERRRQRALVLRVARPGHAQTLALSRLRSATPTS